jgi:hypothetical protein
VSQKNRDKTMAKKRGRGQTAIKNQIEKRRKCNKTLCKKMKRGGKKL